MIVRGMEALSFAKQSDAADRLHCFSYSPLPSRLSTVNPAFFASLMETGFVFCGELKPEINFRTGFLHAGQAFNSVAVMGRRSVKRPPHAAQLPSHNSYS